MTTASIHTRHPAAGLRRHLTSAINAALPAVLHALACTVALASVVVFRVLAFVPV